MARKAAPKPRKQPSQGRSRFTVQQIVQAAARVFEQRGFAGATTNHIAARAGVSVESLYQHFPNKESILVVLLEEAPRPPHMRQMQERIEQEAVATALGLLQANPQVRVSDVKTAAYLLVHTIETLTHAYVAAPAEQLDPRRFADGLVEMMVRYLVGPAAGQRG